MFKKKDGLLILFVLLVAGCIFLYQYISSIGMESTGRVRIWVDGKVYSEEALGRKREITILQPDGCENVVQLTENGFYMLRSNCRTQQCVDMGEVNENNFFLRHYGTRVTCRANRVEIELLVEKPTDMDLPDI